MFALRACTCYALDKTMDAISSGEQSFASFDILRFTLVITRDDLQIMERDKLSRMKSQSSDSIFDNEPKLLTVLSVRIGKLTTWSGENHAWPEFVSVRLCSNFSPHVIVRNLKRKRKTREQIFCRRISHIIIIINN